MLRCLLGDILAASHALTKQCAEQRPRYARRLIDEAHAAHCYARRFGRAHPVWGNGSLMARALAEGSGKCTLQDKAFLQSLAIVAQALAERSRCSTAEPTSDVLALSAFGPI
jgi:hypothetical protein